MNNSSKLIISFTSSFLKWKIYGFYNLLDIKLLNHCFSNFLKFSLVNITIYSLNSLFSKDGPFINILYNFISLLFLLNFLLFSYLY